MPSLFRCTNLGLGLALLLAPLARPVQAQRLGEAKGFKLAETYGPPHEGQIKSMIEAAKGLPVEGGRQVLLTDMQLRTYSETNNPELLIQAPQCLYDAAGKSASSAGPLHVQTADGQFVIEGEGFWWRQTNSSLFISNHVHTTVQPELLEAAGAHPRSETPPPSTGGIEIFSDWFDYTADSGVGTYRGHVRVSGTNQLNLTSGILRIRLPITQRVLQGITAEQAVVVDYADIHATGERADYAPDTGLIHVTGTPAPAWRADQREGRADELVIDRTNRIFRANGRAWLRMPSQSLGASGFLPVSGSARPGESALPGAATNGFVDVASDSYEFRTNWAVFRNGVQVTEHREDQPAGTMTCGRMTVTFAGTNQLQTMVAEDRVVIEQETNRFTGSKAVYTATNGLLELTGHPAWQAGQRSGKGDLLRLKVQQDEMSVHTNAYMRLPADQLAQAAVPNAGAAGLRTAGARPRVAGGAKPPGDVSASPQPGPQRLEPAADQFAEIFSEHYTIGSAAALFEGGVYVSHPQMNWACESLQVQLQPADGTTRRLTARQSVAFDLRGERGYVHGTGSEAVYTYGVAGGLTNDLLRLVGTPALLITTNGSVQSSVILLDNARNKLTTPPGDWRIHGKGTASDTNAFLLPKVRPAK